MMNKVCHVLFAAILTFGPHNSFATSKFDSEIPLIRKQAQNLDEYKSVIGYINSEKYIAIIVSESSDLILAKIKAYDTYEPIAKAKIMSAQDTSVMFKGNSIIVRYSYSHHGSYDAEYTFHLKNGIFCLSKLIENSSSNKDFNDPSIQILTSSVVNLDNSTMHEWEQRFNLYKNKTEYKPGFRAWERALDRQKKNLPPLGGVSKNVKFKKEREISLDNADFSSISEELYRLTHPSSGTGESVLR